MGKKIIFLSQVRPFLIQDKTTVLQWKPVSYNWSLPKWTAAYLHTSLSSAIIITEFDSSF